jgi:hypothetical protein
METPNKMIGGIAGMAQPNQMQLNQYPNQNALGALGPQIPGIVGQNIPGTTNNVMSNQAGVSAPIMQLDPTKTYAAEMAKMMTLTPPVEKVKEVKEEVLPAVDLGIINSKKKTLKTLAAETAKFGAALMQPPKKLKNLNK